MLRQGKVQESLAFWHLWKKIVFFVVFDNWKSFSIDDFCQKLSNKQIQAFDLNLSHLTSIKFTHNLKNIWFLHFWIIFQWFSLKRKFFGTLLSTEANLADAARSHSSGFCGNKRLQTIARWATGLGHDSKLPAGSASWVSVLIFVDDSPNLTKWPRELQNLEKYWNWSHFKALNSSEYWQF